MAAGPHCGRDRGDGINPNLLTFLGLVVNFGAAASFAVGNFRTGAIIIFIAGFLDMLDGQVARRQNRVTAFGAFLRFDAGPLCGHGPLHGAAGVLLG